MPAGVKSVVALLLAVAVLIYPATVLANDTGGTAAEGTAAGRADGRADTNSVLWFGAGCLFPYGILAAYALAPSPPPTRLLGRSSEYVAAYTAAYQASAKRARTCSAWIGTAVAIPPAVAVTLFIYAFFSFLSHGPIGG
jgi:hypothetical protein